MKKWSSQWTQFMQLRKEAWKKKKKLQDFNEVWTRDLAITGAMLYQLSYEATDVGSRSIVGSYVPVKEMSVIDIWNKSYMNCGNEMKMKKWWSQRTQFMQLRKEAWKKNTKTKTKKRNSGLQRGLKPWPRDYRCDALPNELWSHWRWQQVNCINCVRIFFFLSHFDLFEFVLGFSCSGFSITGATKGYHLDLTVGFSHWSLRSTFSHQVTKVNLFGL